MQQPEDPDGLPEFEIAGVEEDVRAANVGTQIVFPPTGERFGFPAASSDPVEVDLASGDIRVPTSGVENKSLSSRLPEGAADALSAHLWVDANVTIRVFDSFGRQQDSLEATQSGWVNFQGTRVEELHLTSDYPFRTQMMFSTAPAEPRVTRPVMDSQLRFGFLSTDDSLKGVPMVPPDASHFNVGVKDEAARQFGDPVVPTDPVGQLTAIIENTGSNDAEYQLRTRHLDGEKWRADNHVHNTVEDDPAQDANAVRTLSANDADMIESDLHSSFKQIRARSATSGQSTDLRVQWRGVGPSMR